VVSGKFSRFPDFPISRFPDFPKNRKAVILFVL
jgi:hypothetical protein